MGMLRNIGESMKDKFRVLGEYIGHLAIGSAMFLALLAFGGLLNMAIHWIGPVIGDDSFTDLMKLVEKVILYADIAFIVWWAIYSTYRAIKEMTR
jgi:hypothetical protein